MKTPLKLTRVRYQQRAEKATRIGTQKLDIEKIFGLNVRSSWEANFARILKLYKIKSEFEPRVFTFPVKKGTKGYTPDFYFVESEEWIEIKGFLDDKSKIKIKRFKRYYPEEFAKLTMVISRYSSAAKSFVSEMEIPNVIFYEDIRDFYIDKIDNWEGK